MRRLTLRWISAALLAATALLAGCAGPYLMDNTVQSFSSLTGVPVQAGYRFERLPSQLSDPAQVRLEAATESALARLGLRRDDAAARYTVQVWSRMQQTYSPWAGPRWSGWGGVGWGGHRGGSIGLGMGVPIGGWDTPWYQREIGLVLRDVTTGQVVYETRAYNDGRWIAPEVALPAMLEAALQGFPTPPAGLRRVDVRVMR